MKTVTFKIEGMHCDGCAETIQSLLERERGVRKAAVSFRDREARVLYDSQAIREEELVATIQKPGFRIASRRE